MFSRSALANPSLFRTKNGLRKWGEQKAILRPIAPKQTFYNAPICPENALHHQNIHAILEKHTGASLHSTRMRVLKQVGFNVDLLWWNASLHSTRMRVLKPDFEYILLNDSAALHSTPPE
jgi:hypothetical protein